MSDIRRNSTEEVMLKLWDIGNLPREITCTVFDISYARAIEKVSDQDEDEFKKILYEEGLPLINLVSICRDIYVGKEKPKGGVPEEMVKVLEGVKLWGSIRIVKGGMGREVIEWSYRLSTNRMIDMNTKEIQEELRRNRYEDMLKINPILKDYCFQIEESWNDVDNGIIGCYLGALNT